MMNINILADTCSHCPKKDKNKVEVMYGRCSGMTKDTLKQWLLPRYKGDRKERDKRGEGREIIA